MTCASPVAQQVMPGFVCSGVVTTTTEAEAPSWSRENPRQPSGAARTVLLAILGSVFEERRFNDAQQNDTCSQSARPFEAPAPSTGSISPLKGNQLGQNGVAGLGRGCPSRDARRGRSEAA